MKSGGFLSASMWLFVVSVAVRSGKRRADVKGNDHGIVDIDVNYESEPWLKKKKKEKESKKKKKI